MNTNTARTKTKRDFARMVAQYGGTLEEDTGFRGSRVFQAVAPDGKLWAGDDVQCLRIEVCGDANEQFAWAESILSSGLRDIRPDEAELYAND